jgi:hypothetical protein
MVSAVASFPCGTFEAWEPGLGVVALCLAGLEGEDEIHRAQH